MRFAALDLRARVGMLRRHWERDSADLQVRLERVVQASPVRENKAATRRARPAALARTWLCHRVRCLGKSAAVADQVSLGDEISVSLARGELGATVRNKKPNPSKLPDYRYTSRLWPTCNYGDGSLRRQFHKLSDGNRRCEFSTRLDPSAFGSLQDVDCRESAMIAFLILSRSRAFSASQFLLGAREDIEKIGHFLERSIVPHSLLNTGWEFRQML